MIPHVRRLTELNPRRRRIHVRGEVHPGELAERGYRSDGEDLVREISTTEELIAEFQALQDLHYAFLEGEEWSPAEIYQRFLDMGKLRGDPRTVQGG
jgi:hypothetical protein